MNFKNESAYLGSVKGPNGGVGGGQARLNQLPCDPTMIFMAATMLCINMKLDAIQETQQEILEYLEQKEKSELRGNIIFLSGIIEDYKHNWNNEQYLYNAHLKALDIRQKAEQSILFAQQRIKNIMGKKKLVQISADVNVRLRKLVLAFEDYQLAMYMYALAYYVEAMLLKNFDKEYMDSIASKIENYSIEYREMYTDAYNLLAQYNDKSLDNIALRGLSKLTKAAGEAAAKIQIMDDIELDDGLMAIGDMLDGEEENNKKLSVFVSKQSSYVAPFIENIRMMGELHNKPLKMMFDDDNIYMEKIAV